MVNSNPETVSTDYDTSDKLFFEPLTLEDVLHIYEAGEVLGRDRAIRRANAAEPGAGIEEERGQHHRDVAGEHRGGGGPQIIFRDAGQAANSATAERPGNERDGGAGSGAGNWVTRCWCGRRLCWAGARCRLCIRTRSWDHYMRFAVEASPERPVLVDKFLEDATEVDVDCIADVGQFADPKDGTSVIGGMLEHIEYAGVHSGDAAMVLPPHHAVGEGDRHHARLHARDGARVARGRPDECAICGEGRHGLRAGGQPAGVAHGCHL